MKKAPERYVTPQKVNGILLLTFIEPTLCADAVNEAAAVIDSTENRLVVLDLQLVRSLVSGSLYPDQEPFKLLLSLRKRLSANGRRLLLSNIAPEIAEILRITRLDQIFEIQPNLEAAIAEAKTTCVD